MFNEVLEARSVCDYLLDEIEITMKKLKGVMGFGIFDIFGKGTFSGVAKKVRMEEVDKHMNHIKFGIKKLQYALYDMNEGDEFGAEIGLDYPISIWIDSFFTDSFVKGEMKVLYQELAQLKTLVEKIKEKLSPEEARLFVG